MMAKTALLTLALIPSLRCTLSEDQAGFHPKESEVLRKAFRSEVTLELDALEIRMGGEPVPEEMPEVAIRTERRRVLEDEYEDVADGRVLRLLRTLPELAGTSTVTLDRDGAHEEHAVKHKSALQDAVVLFEWNEELGEYQRSFEQGGDDTQRLETLELDADLLGFLPPGPVEKGDTWSVDPRVLESVFAPGGDVGILPAELSGDPFADLELPVVVGGTLTSLGEAEEAFAGSLEATYTGSEELDGVRVGRIEFEVDARASVDLAERLEQALENVAAGEGFDLRSYSQEWKLGGKGELLWDLKEGHAHALTLELEVELEAHLGWTVGFMDQELDLDGQYTLSGNAKAEMALAR
jgi:hypothetical protein